MSLVREIFKEDTQKNGKWISKKQVSKCKNDNFSKSKHWIFSAINISLFWSTYKTAVWRWHALITEMSIIAWNPLFLTKKIDRFDVKTAFRCFLSHFSVCEPILITYFYSKRVIPNYEWPRSIRLCRNQCNVLDLTIFNKLFKLLVAIAFSIFYRRVENSIRDHWNSYLPIANVCKPFISRILIAVHALCHTVFWLRAGTNSRLRSWIIDHHFSVKCLTVDVNHKRVLETTSNDWIPISCFLFLQAEMRTLFRIT